MEIPSAIAEAFRRFESGEYLAEVDRSEQLFYSKEKLTKHPDLQFQRDKPPFIFEGDLTNGEPKYITWGINPKDSGTRSLGPSCLEEYYREALGAFHKWPPSRFHDRLLRIVSGIAGLEYPDARVATWPWAKRHYLTFDMVPYYASRWNVQLTKFRLEPIVNHLVMCERLLRCVDVKFAILNGKPFVDLFVGDWKRQPLLNGRFTLKHEIRYSDLKTRNGENMRDTSTNDERPIGRILLGFLTLANKRLPAALLSVFVHQARPPFSGVELKGLGHVIGEWISSLNCSYS